MKIRPSILVVVCSLLVSAFPANAGGTGSPGHPCCHDKVAASLGLRYERPVADLKVGQKAPATITNAAKLSAHGLTVKGNDKVVLTLTAKNTFSLFHAGSGRTVNFRVDGEGNLTLVR